MGTQDQDVAVLNFQDSLLRRSDVELLEKRQWLNDKIIGFMFEYFEYEQFKNLEKVLFVNPDVAQYIKLCEGTELCIFLEPLQLHLKTTIFVPVNNNINPNSTGGTHWSLLVYDKSAEQFQHYDSVSMCNKIQAIMISSAIEPFLKAKQKIKFIEQHCPQQVNSYDCGVYLIAVTEYLCEQKQNTTQKSLDDQVSYDSVKRKREEIKKIIHSLKEKQ